MVLKDQTIFMLSLMRHDSAIESTNYTLARHLAGHNQVYYIDNPYTYKDLLLRRDAAAFRRRNGHFAAGPAGILHTAIPSLKVVITPPVASINWLPEGGIYRLMVRANERTVQQRVTQVIQKAGIRAPIFINSFNFYFPHLSRLLRPKLSVYHCVDPLVHPYELRHGAGLEAQAARGSDLVICTSRQLCSLHSRNNPQTYFIPNAADPGHAGKALDPALPVHPLLRDIPGPVAGYLGAIERRLDFDLLHQVIRQNRNISFVFAGPLHREFLPGWFFKEPNLYPIGPIPYAETPQVLKGFDAALVPFKKDEHSAGIFPLKLFEYLGAGLPVVATDFNPDLEHHTGGTVAYRGDAADFSQALADAIQDNNDQKRAARLAVAAQNSWSRRADEFAALINTRLLQKASRAAADNQPVLQ